MKALAGSCPQVGGQMKIVVRGHGANVPEISGKVREFGLDFYPLLIPPVQSRYGEAMAQVMKPWRTTLSIEDPRGQAELLPVGV